MDYQIKSTPFFRRMLSTSKKNGQLQRLKEEYDRMKVFNDRAIEIKMRQVRLKRLFREIEEIKESSSQLPKRHRMASKSNNEIRLETFVKAKELGKEYSKINALLTSTNRMEHYQRAPSVAGVQGEHKKQLMAKALKYGNESSTANLEKSTLGPQKSSIKPVVKSKSAINQSVERERLKHRNSYGNTRSNINMSKIIDRKRHLKSLANRAEIAARKPQTTRINIVSCNSGEEDNVKRYGGKLHPTESDVFEIFDPSCDIKGAPKSYDLPSDDNRLRATHHWHTLAAVVQNSFNSHHLIDGNSEDDGQFRLQNSENGIDLTQIIGTSESTDVPQQSELFDDAVSNEVLVNVQPLFDPEQWIGQPDQQAQQSQASAESGSSLGQNDAVVSPNVQILAKIFEPVVREAAQKEAFDGVRKLKSIFEN